MLYLIRNNTVKLNIQWVTSSKPNWRHFWNTRYGFDCCHFLNHSWWVNKGPPPPTVRTVLNKCQCPSIIQFSNQSPTQETCVDSVLILYKWIFALVLCLCTCSSCDCLLSPPAPRCLTALPSHVLQHRNVQLFFTSSRPLTPSCLPPLSSSLHKMPSSPLTAPVIPTCPFTSNYSVYFLS